MPNFGFLGATDGAAAPVPLLGSSSIGFWWPVSISRAVSDTTHSRSATSALLAITAKGLRDLLLRSRKSLTASSLVASQARWKPPMPLTATMPPEAMVWRAWVMAAGPSRSVSRIRTVGPQSLQQTGCAS